MDLRKHSNREIGLNDGLVANAIAVLDHFAIETRWMAAPPHLACSINVLMVHLWSIVAPPSGSLFSAPQR